ncbi:MAG: TetR/AcrR family transcriptional regulator, partial [Bacteroidetes bacterium]|nr:TetR/AcrR family transcriptional regulator [Bacteroidota bacterium]MBU1116213.1 TetR/AcrR family transcriptional regulator [Bacteroidota bacterium]MBU1798589.1 TetR/AcrR family transcriptional regulator [Bacteroidota bacterium]
MKINKFDKKRDEIKAAGIKSFAAYGYSKTTLEDIANMLGMKKNSLYYYFESKEALFRELIEEEIKDHIQYLDKIILENLPADQKILKVIKSLALFIRERTLSYTVKLSAFIELSKVIKNEFQDLQNNECKVIEAILIEGVESGLFIKHDTKIVAKDIEYLVPAIFRSHYTDSNAEFVHEVDFENISLMVERLINYIINGIKLNKK